MQIPLTRRRKLIHAGLAVLLSLVLAEGLARVWLTLERTPLHLAEVRGGSVHTSWFPVLLEDLGAKNGERLYVPDPDLFWTLRPGVRLHPRNVVYQTRDEPVRWRLQIDKEGHRGPPWPPDSSGDHPVILCLGDSCTFGFRVDDDATYPAQLQVYLREHGLPRAVVVNQGVPGYTSFQGKLLLKWLLSRHHPDIVLISFGANDHEADHFSDADKARRNHTVLGAARRLLSNLAMARFIWSRGAGQRTPPDSGTLSPRVSPNEFRKNLIDMIHTAREGDAKAYLIDLAFMAPGFGRLMTEISHTTGTPCLQGTQILRDELRELHQGGALAAEATRMDRFWNERVTRYRYVYYAPSLYQELFADATWSALLHYLMVEPVHPNRLGHRLLAAAIGARLLADRGK